MKISVACQTDSNDDDDWKSKFSEKFSSLFNNYLFCLDDQMDKSNDETPNGSTAEQQTVAHELCPMKGIFDRFLKSKFSLLDELILDDDGSKPEGTLRLMIHNFRNMNDTVRGPPKLVSGVPWYVLAVSNFFAFFRFNLMFSGKLWLCLDSTSSQKRERKNVSVSSFSAVLSLILSKKNFIVTKKRFIVTFHLVRGYVKRPPNLD